MPKRSADDKIERYKRKIQKIQQEKERGEIRKRVRRIIFSESSDDNEGDAGTRPEPQDTSTAPPGVQLESSRDVTPPGDVVATDTQNGEPESADDRPASTPQNQELVMSQDEAVNGVSVSEPELDPELLEALGESTDSLPEYGAGIHENLAKLWLPLLKKGMTKEMKEKMLKDYLIPDNCRLLQAPKLNAEISAAVPDMVRNRDKGLIAHQQQLGSGITAINRALDLLLKGENKKEAIQQLSNACRLLSDLHSIWTQSRIKLISPSLDKSVLQIIQNTERDETLFGTKLAEEIRAAKAIEKQGLQIKKPTPKAPHPNTSQSTNNRQGPYSENWTAPPRYSSNRGRGGSKRGSQNRRSYPYQNPATRPAAQPSTSKPRAPTN